jgi:hypothetical protein
MCVRAQRRSRPGFRDRRRGGSAQRRALPGLRRLLGRHGGEVAVSEPADTGVGARRPAPGRLRRRRRRGSARSASEGRAQTRKSRSTPVAAGRPSTWRRRGQASTIRGRLRAAAPLGCCARWRRAPLARTDSSPRVRCAEREAGQKCARGRPLPSGRMPRPSTRPATAAGKTIVRQRRKLATDDGQILRTNPDPPSRSGPGCGSPRGHGLASGTPHQRRSAPDAHQAPSRRPAARRRRRRRGAMSPARSPAAGAQARAAAVRDASDEPGRAGNAVRAIKVRLTRRGARPPAQGAAAPGRVGLRATVGAGSRSRLVRGPCGSDVSPAYARRQRQYRGTLPTGSKQRASPWFELPSRNRIFLTSRLNGPLYLST